MFSQYIRIVAHTPETNVICQVYLNYKNIYMYKYCSVKGGSEKRISKVHVEGTRNAFRFNSKLVLRTDE